MMAKHFEPHEDYNATKIDFASPTIGICDDLSYNFAIDPLQIDWI